MRETIYVDYSFLVGQWPDASIRKSSMEVLLDHEFKEYALIGEWAFDDFSDDEKEACQDLVHHWVLEHYPGYTEVVI